MKNIFLLLILLFPCFGSAQENPLMQLAGKKYSEYSQDFLFHFKEVFRTDSAECRNIMRHTEEVGRKTGNMEWKLLSEYLEIIMFEETVLLHGKELYPFEELYRFEIELLDKAKKAKTLPIELIVRKKLIDLCFNNLLNYELGLEECSIQGKILQTVSAEDIPEKSHLYLQIANTYYAFKDYTRAIYYFQKIIEEKETIHSQFSQQNARNGIGLIYLITNKLDSAQIYFQAMRQVIYLNVYNESFRDILDAIAEGNMGAVMLKREEYDTAIPLFESSLEKSLRFNDIPFAGSRAVDLATAYLKKENLSEAKKYIDLAITYRNKVKYPRNKDIFYEVLSKYYAATGNTKLCIQYMDSCLQTKEQQEERYSDMRILRMEQKESAKHQLELTNEKELRRDTQIRLLMISIGFIIILTLSVLLFILYRKKNKAYRELVRKFQEWAQTPTIYPQDLQIADDQSESEDPINEVDIKLFEQFLQLLQTKHLYRQNNITIEKTASLINSNRTYLSHAINKCTGKNFTSCINEYRIKEALQMMSNHSKKFSFEGIAFEVGFNDRKTFYTAFKKITGFTPSIFRNNMSLL